MLVVWGRANSSNVMKVIWLLEELGTPYERREAGGPKARLNTPEFTALNPNQQIPVLQDGDFTLWESNAILRYLASTKPAGAAFYPAEPRVRADIERWLDWQQTTLSGAFGRLFYNVARTPKAQQDERVIARALEGAARVWRVLEDRLGETGGVVGSELSLADIAIGPSLHRWFALPVGRPAFPRLEAWHALLLARPAYTRHVAS